MMRKPLKESEPRKERKPSSGSEPNKMRKPNFSSVFLKLLKN
jgi:hypothetical protein